MPARPATVVCIHVHVSKRPRVHSARAAEDVGMLGGLVASTLEGDALGLGLACNEPLPESAVLLDDLEGIVPGLGLALKGELVAVGALVVPEPHVGLVEVAGHLLLDIVNVVELLGERIVHVDGDDLPISLTLVDESHGAEHLDLLDVTGLGDGAADLANVERVLVAEGISVGVLVRGVLPGLREGTIVPHVALTILDEAELAVLDVLLDGVEGFLLADLKLGPGVLGDLNNHVEDALLRIDGEGNVVEGRDPLTILLEEEPVLEGALLTFSLGGVAHDGDWKRFERRNPM